jgi:hypothetical protein
LEPDPGSMLAARGEAAAVFESLKIVLAGTVAAIVYGELHDQVTAHVCVEYFSVAHPPVLAGTHSPFWLAVAWGVLATWWVGLPLGIFAAAAARLGSWPRLGWRDLAPEIVGLMLASGVAAAVMGIVGAVLVAQGRAPVPLGWGSIIPPAKQAAFAFDAWAHMTSYAAGAVGGLVVVGRILWRRGRAADVRPALAH